jgi:kynureninase
MANKLIFIIIFIFGSFSYAQQNDYKATPNDFTITGADTTLKTASRKTGRKLENQSLPQYSIMTKQYVARSSFQKLGPGHEVRIRILRSGTNNSDIEDFAMAYKTGNEYRTGNIIGIDNITFPFYNKVTYRSWNTFHAVQYDVIFEFTINEPGIWDVTINN